MLQQLLLRFRLALEVPFRDVLAYVVGVGGEVQPDCQREGGEEEEEGVEDIGVLKV